MLAKKINIKFVTLNFNLQSGGGANLTLDLMIRFLLGQGYSVSLITTQENTSASAPYQIKSAKIYGKFLLIQDKIAKLLQEEEKDCDIFIAYGPALIWGSGLYRKRGGKTPVIAFVNNYLPLMSQSNLELSPNLLSRLKDIFFHFKIRLWYLIWGKSWARYIDFYLFDSPVLLNIYKGYGFDNKKLGVLPEFINVPQTKDIGPEKLAKTPANLLYVGRIVYDKGLDLLIEALSQLDKSTLRLDIVGAGQEKTNLESLVKNLDLESVVSFHPWLDQEQLANFYAQSQIFIHPCRWVEPFGRTIVEAMAHGLPIITTEGTGSTWVMGPAGLSFKNSDVRDLSEKIKILISNQELRKNLQVLARERAASFDKSIVGPQFEKKIREFIDSQRN